MESRQPVEWVTEENYKFRLSSFAAPLLAWLNQEPSPGARCTPHPEFLFVTALSLPRLPQARLHRFHPERPSGHKVTPLVQALCALLKPLPLPCHPVTLSPLHQRVATCRSHRMGNSCASAAPHPALSALPSCVTLSRCRRMPVIASTCGWTHSPTTSPCAVLPALFCSTFPALFCNTFPELFVEIFIRFL
jgi:hypothetical protein